MDKKYVIRLIPKVDNRPPFYARRVYYASTQVGGEAGSEDLSKATEYSEDEVDYVLRNCRKYYPEYYSEAFLLKPETDRLVAR